MDPMGNDKKALGIESIDEKCLNIWWKVKLGQAYCREYILAGFLKHIRIVRPKQATFPKVGQ